MKLATHHP